MTAIRKSTVFSLILLLLANSGAYCNAWADHDDHKEKKWYQKVFDRDDEDHDEDDDHKRDSKSFRHSGEGYLNPVNNATYKEQCGACHFVYLPELLPSASWGKIMAGLGDHFGETIELDSDSQKIIGDYLKNNACEHSSAKRALQITRNLGSRTPLRITEIPYIQEEHHELTNDVLKRKSIGSLSNCSACHTTAEKGIFEDDYVAIPK
jgi:hypothetical protein